MGDTLIAHQAPPYEGGASDEPSPQTTEAGPLPSQVSDSLALALHLVTTHLALLASITEAVHLTLHLPSVAISTKLQNHHISDVVAFTATPSIGSNNEPTTTNPDGGILTVSHRSNTSSCSSHKRSDAATSLVALGLLNVAFVSLSSQHPQRAITAAAPVKVPNAPPPRPAPKPHPTGPHQSGITTPNKPPPRPPPKPHPTGPYQT